MKICKEDLIKDIAAKNELSLEKAKNILNNVTELITSHLEKGDSVTLTGFGTFSVKAVQARKGRNMKTGETIVIPACNKIKFKASDSTIARIKAKKSTKKASKPAAKTVKAPAKTTKAPAKAAKPAKAKKTAKK